MKAGFLTTWAQGFALALLPLSLTGAQSVKEEAAQNSIPTVAVLDFTGPAAESNRWAWAEGGMADLLQIELQQLGLALLDRDLIHAVLSEQRLSAHNLTAEGQIQAGSLLHARHLVTGRIVPLERGRVRLEATAFSVEAIETVSSGVAEGAFPKELPALLHSLANTLAGKLKAAGTAVAERDVPRSAYKPEALILFYRGLNACAQGQPEVAVSWFVDSEAMDAEFAAPLLWEIKAYELAGLPQHANIRREETAAMFKRLGIEPPPPATGDARGRTPVLTVLDVAVMNGNGDEAARLSSIVAAAIKQSIMGTGQSRLLAFENIGDAVAEQDLKLSSLFARQGAPRYGRWLMSDGLVLCRLNEQEPSEATLKLTLIDPPTAAALASVERHGKRGEEASLATEAARVLLADWTRKRTADAPAPLREIQEDRLSELETHELRPAYKRLALALNQVRRAPTESEGHRALADAFGSAGRYRQAAAEIEHCLENLDILAPKAAQTYFGIHRWLFWAGGASPPAPAIALADQKMIKEVIQQLLTSYPESLAAGCMHYNLAVDDWHAGNWLEASQHAARVRQVIEPRPLKEQCDLELVAATFFLEGSSLRKLGRLDEAEGVLKQGLAFMKEFQVREVALPLGPAINDFFGPEQVSGYGGDRPDVRTRIEQELALFVKIPAQKPAVAPLAGHTPGGEAAVPGAAWLKSAQSNADSGRYLEALDCYRKAVADGSPLAQCPGLSATLVKAALAVNPARPRDEAQRLSAEFGFSPFEPAWFDWFNRGRKVQEAHQNEKAIACYQIVIEFLENPEKSGVYHLEKQPGSNGVALRWGRSSGEADMRWSDRYSARWHSAAFYLAQCLLEAGRLEESAGWLRRIALSLGGDREDLLIETSWFQERYTTQPLGVRAGEMLKQLHAEPPDLESGTSNIPVKGS